MAQIQEQVELEQVAGADRLSIDRLVEKVEKSIIDGSLKSLEVYLTKTGTHCLGNECWVSVRLDAKLTYKNGREEEYGWYEKVPSGQMWISDFLNSRLEDVFNELEDIGLESVDERCTEYKEFHTAGKHIEGYVFNLECKT